MGGDAPKGVLLRLTAPFRETRQNGRISLYGINFLDSLVSPLYQVNTANRMFVCRRVIHAQHKTCSFQKKKKKVMARWVGWRHCKTFGSSNRQRRKKTRELRLQDAYTVVCQVKVYSTCYVEAIATRSPPSVQNLTPSRGGAARQHRFHLCAESPQIDEALVTIAYLGSQA